MTSFLLAFILICAEAETYCKWHPPGELKGWEVTEVGDPRLCTDGAKILNTYPMPYVDYYKRKVMKIKAMCVVVEGK